MTLVDILLFLLVISILFVIYYLFVRKRSDDEGAPRKKKDLNQKKAAGSALSSARRYAKLHEYQVIAPAALAKDGKSADLDFIIVGWFGLLCVKCIGLGGQIYGNAGDAMWLQVNGEKRVSFKNPIKQAEEDTRLVRDILISSKMHGIRVESICVFTNSSASLALPRGTGHYTLKEFKALLGKSKYEQDKGVDVNKTADALKKWLVNS